MRVHLINKELGLKMCKNPETVTHLHAETTPGTEEANVSWSLDFK
jgi:hypothetical protein